MKEINNQISEVTKINEELTKLAEMSESFGSF
jgi:hypothetical protein